MLFVGNLNRFVKNMIDSNNHGIFFPQNSEYVETADMVQKIGLVNGKKIKKVSYFNWTINLLSFVPGKIGNLVNKAFGSLTYEKTEQPINFVNFEDSVFYSIGRKEHE